MNHTIKAIAVAIVCAVTSGASAQPWMDNVKSKQSPNFYDIQNAFNAYWQGRAIEKGKGWKQFKRWEYFMEPRVHPTGELPDPMILLHEFNQYKKTHAAMQAAGNWTLLGPKAKPSNGGNGRVNCIAFDPTNSSIIWVGTPGGGLWKSTDAGATWSCNTDDLPTLGVSDIAIDPTNKNIMYLGTGDADGSDTYGVGVLKSTNGGNTWNTTGLNWTITQTRTVRRLLVNPLKTSVILAGTSSGIYKSTDGGTTWSQKSTVAMRDMEYKPGDTTIVYASSNTGFYRSTNGGDTWTKITGGLPTSGIRRIAIEVTPADASMVYALIAASDDGFYGMYRSTDGGLNFTQRSNSPNLLGWQSNGSDSGGQGWYDLALAVSPVDANVVFVGGVNAWKSTNGGTNWTCVAHWSGSGAPYIHADNHAMKFLPGSGTTLYACNDGGVFVTANGGSSWSDKSSGLEISQFYNLGTSATNDKLVLCGAQDNGTDRWNNGAWARVIGGDGMECIIDHSNASIMYGELYYGDIRKSTNGGSSFSSIKPSGAGNGGWVTPYVMHPTNSQILVAGYKDVYKTTNAGSSWTAISSSLTGGSNLVAVALAPSDANNVIYAASSSKIFKTVNGGPTGPK